MFLERSPFVPWAQQRPAFVHPAFTGVVHPDLPLWSGVSNAPPEPRPESRSALPRVARLTTLEARDQPPFHVQTISAARCLSEDDARRKIIAAATHGAAALLLVSGDAPNDAAAAARGPRLVPVPGESPRVARLARVTLRGVPRAFRGRYTPPRRSSGASPTRRSRRRRPRHVSHRRRFRRAQRA